MTLTNKGSVPIFRRIFVAGLGNPGRKYSRTRHNCGFRVVDGLITALGATGRKKVRGNRWRTWDAYRGDQYFWVLKPMTYMNRSGGAVAGFLDTLSGEEPDLHLVVSDDINLPVGRLRLREKGSSGGHRGLDSLIQHLGGERFGRLRIGVGSPPPGEDSSEYVLEPVASFEAESLSQAEDRAVEAVLYLADCGWEAAMSRFNSKPGVEGD